MSGKEEKDTSGKTGGKAQGPSVDDKHGKGSAAKAAKGADGAGKSRNGIAGTEKPAEGKDKGGGKDVGGDKAVVDGKAAGGDSPATGKHKGPFHRGKAAENGKPGRAHGGKGADGQPAAGASAKPNGKEAGPATGAGTRPGGAGDAKGHAVLSGNGNGKAASTGAASAGGTSTEGALTGGKQPATGKRALPAGKGGAPAKKGSPIEGGESGGQGGPEGGKPGGSKKKAKVAAAICVAAAIAVAAGAGIGYGISQHDLAQQQNSELQARIAELENGQKQKPDDLVIRSHDGDEKSQSGEASGAKDRKDGKDAGQSAGDGQKAEKDSKAGSDAGARGHGDGKADDKANGKTDGKAKSGKHLKGGTHEQAGSTSKKKDEAKPSKAGGADEKATRTEKEASDQARKKARTRHAEKRHTHQWIDRVRTVHHRAVTRTVNYPAKYRVVTQYHTICNDCGKQIDGHAAEHIERTGHSGYTTRVPVKVRELVSPAHTETVTVRKAHDTYVKDGQICKICGKTRK